jgi:hypothetical protein
MLRQEAPAPNTALDRERPHQLDCRCARVTRAAEHPRHRRGPPVWRMRQRHVQHRLNRKRLRQVRCPRGHPRPQSARLSRSMARRRRAVTLPHHARPKTNLGDFLGDGHATHPIPSQPSAARTDRASERVNSRRQAKCAWRYGRCACASARARLRVCPFLRVCVSARLRAENGKPSAPGDMEVRVCACAFARGERMARRAGRVY